MAAQNPKLQKLSGEGGDSAKTSTVFMEADSGITVTPPASVRDRKGQAEKVSSERDSDVVVSSPDEIPKIDKLRIKLPLKCSTNPSAAAMARGHSEALGYGVYVQRTAGKKRSASPPSAQGPSKKKKFSWESSSGSDSSGSENNDGAEQMHKWKKASDAKPRSIRQFIDKLSESRVTVLNGLLSRLQIIAQNGKYAHLRPSLDRLRIVKRYLEQCKARVSDEGECGICARLAKMWVTHLGDPRKVHKWERAIRGPACLMHNAEAFMHDMHRFRESIKRFAKKTPIPYESLSSLTDSANNAVDEDDVLSDESDESDEESEKSSGGVQSGEEPSDPGDPAPSNDATAATK